MKPIVLNWPIVLRWKRHPSLSLWYLCGGRHVGCAANVNELGNWVVDMSGLIVRSNSTPGPGVDEGKMQAAGLMRRIMAVVGTIFRSDVGGRNG